MPATHRLPRSSMSCTGVVPCRLSLISLENDLDVSRFCNVSVLRHMGNRFGFVIAIAAMKNRFSEMLSEIKLHNLVVAFSQ
jgi:hypothetical protein